MCLPLVLFSPSTVVFVGFIHILYSLPSYAVTTKSLPRLPPDLQVSILAPLPCQLGRPAGCSTQLSHPLPPTSLLSFSVVCVGGYLSCQPIWKHSHTSGKVLFSPQRTVFIPYPSSHASSTALVQAFIISYWIWCNSLLRRLALQSCPSTFQSSLCPSLHAFFSLYS